jgi:Holliday junction resolvase
MGLNAKQKGNRFERQISKIINKKFENANCRRTPLSGGMDFKGDICSINDNSIVSEFSWECKNQEKLNIWKALEQSRNDAPQRTMPVVVFTRNFETEYACIEFEDFLNILKELEDLRNG